MINKITLILAVLLVLPLVTAVSISDTNLSSGDNFVNVNSVTLTKLVINSTDIELYNVSSTGTEFTNVNATYNASLYFYGLIVDLGVFNVNETFYLFNSTVGDQDYSATFQPKYILRIVSTIPFVIGNTTCENVTTSKITIRMSDDYKNGVSPYGKMGSGNGASPYGRMCYGINFISYLSSIIRWIKI